MHYILKEFCAVDPCVCLYVSGYNRIIVYFCTTSGTGDRSTFVCLPSHDFFKSSMMLTKLIQIESSNISLPQKEDISKALPANHKVLHHTPALIICHTSQLIQRWHGEVTRAAQGHTCWVWRSLQLTLQQQQRQHQIWN